VQNSSVGEMVSPTQLLGMMLVEKRMLLYKALRAQTKSQKKIVGFDR
jgi:hypothetical protein